MSRPANASNITLADAIAKYSAEYLANMYKSDVPLTELAKILGISRATLYNLLNYYKIEYRENIQKKASRLKISSINIEEFNSFIKENGAVAAWKHFKLSRKYFYRLCKDLNIDYCDNKCLKNTAANKKEKIISDIGQSTLHDSIIKFGYLGTTKVLNISRTTLDYYIDNYDADILKNAKNKNSNNSYYNNKFKNILKAKSIQYSREFILNKKRFDFKLADLLIEIDPARTHNIDGNDSRYGPVAFNYHQQKSLIALKAGYAIKHIYQWDDFSLDFLQDARYNIDIKDNLIICELYGNFTKEALVDLIVSYPIENKKTMIKIIADLNHCSLYLGDDYRLIDPKLYYFNSITEKIEPIYLDNGKMYRIADAGKISWSMSIDELLNLKDRS